VCKRLWCVCMHNVCVYACMVCGQVLELKEEEGTHLSFKGLLAKASFPCRSNLAFIKS